VTKHGAVMPVCSFSKRGLLGAARSDAVATYQVDRRVGWTVRSEMRPLMIGGPMERQRRLRTAEGSVGTASPSSL